MIVPRRGSVIIAVLLLLAIGVVIAAGVLVASDAAGAVSRAEQSRTQTRALAWSGVQAVMAELAQQRESLLEGASPNLTAEWDLFTLDDGSRGVVRLIDLDAGGEGLAIGESAKLDLNHATAEMLAKVPGLDESLAGRIVSAREAQPFSSVEQLLEIEGIDPGLLYGEAPQELDPLAERPGAMESLAPIAGGRGLAGFLTVFAFDPNVQIGLDGESDARGLLRVNLNQEWSESLRDAIADRLGDAAADGVEALMKSGRTFSSDADLVRAMIDLDLPPEDWGEILDVFTTTGDEFLLGRVDVNRASAEVLACIPGISEIQAAQIVEARASLDAETRRSPCWPVDDGILAPEEYASAADSLVARSMQWRVRVEVGIERDERGAAGTSFGEDGLAPLGADELADSWELGAMETGLEHRMVWEAVIDAGSTRPRVAYLRDVSSLEPVLGLLADARAAASENGLALDLGGPPGGPGLPGLPMEDEAAEDPFLEGEADLDFGAGDGRDSGADSGDGIGAGGGAGRGSGRQPGASGGGTEEPSDSDSRAGAGAGTDSGHPADRRIGRWTTRKAGNP